MLSQSPARPLAALTLALCLSPLAGATPQLACRLEFAGQTQTLQAAPHPDPYLRHRLAVGERFAFVAVIVGEGERVDYVKTYAYAPDGTRNRLLHQATYLRPARSAAGRDDGLTGEQRVYAPELEHELRYACALREPA